MASLLPHLTRCQAIHLFLQYSNHSEIELTLDLSFVCQRAYLFSGLHQTKIVLLHAIRSYAIILSSHLCQASCCRAATSVRLPRIVCRQRHLLPSSCSLFGFSRILCVIDEIVTTQSLIMTHNEHVILGALESGYITVDHLEHNKALSTSKSWASNRTFFSDTVIHNIDLLSEMLRTRSMLVNLSSSLIWWRSSSKAWMK